MPDSTRITVRLPPELATQVTDRAHAQGVSQNEWITRALAYAITSATGKDVKITETRRISL